MDPTKACQSANHQNQHSPDDELIDKIAHKIYRLHLETPAILLLEMMKPINLIGSSLGIVFEPFVNGFLHLSNYDRFCNLMSDRKNVEKLISNIEKYINMEAQKS